MDDEVVQLTLTHDGEQVVAADIAGNLRVLDSSDGSLVRSISLPTASPSTVPSTVAREEFSRDFETLLRNAGSVDAVSQAEECRTDDGRDGEVDGAMGSSMGKIHPFSGGQRRTSRGRLRLKGSADRHQS